MFLTQVLTFYDFHDPNQNADFQAWKIACENYMTRSKPAQQHSVPESINFVTKEVTPLNQLKTYISKGRVQRLATPLACNGLWPSLS